MLHEYKPGDCQSGVRLFYTQGGWYAAKAVDVGSGVKVRGPQFMTTTKRNSILLQAGLVSTLAVLVASGPNALADEQPRLVLQITVDALRGDLPGRFNSVLGDGGFRYLMQDGIHYTNAHYQHANTETIVGHVSLATGTVPAAHG
ncbi:MAG: alkaline phosphatase family protein, partial [Pseudomonadales bacterium]